MRMSDWSSACARPIYGRLRRQRHRPLLQAPAVGAGGARRALAGVADGAGADAVRRRRAAGLAWRPAGRPPPARRPFAQYRGGPGVRADGAAAGAGAADPGADAAAPDRHPGALAAELSRLVRRYRDPVGGAAHAPRSEEHTSELQSLMR